MQTNTVVVRYAKTRGVNNDIFAHFANCDGHGAVPKVRKLTERDMKELGCIVGGGWHGVHPYLLPTI